MTKESDRSSTAEVEVAEGFRQTLELRSNREGDSVSEGQEKSARARRPQQPPSTSEVAVVPVEKASWLPPVVSFTDDDVAYLVNELLRLGVDVSADLAQRGVEAVNPSMAFVRIDVARRTAELAAMVMDRARRMSTLATGEMPAIKIEDLK